MLTRFLSLKLFSFHLQSMAIPCHFLIVSLASLLVLPIHGKASSTCFDPEGQPASLQDSECSKSNIADAPSGRSISKAFTDDLDDDDLPVVLSASRLKQTNRQAPSIITVIDRELIDLSGARSVVELMRLVPGFQVGRYTYGDPVATYQGQSNRYNSRIQLLIDGRPAYVPLYGGVPWSELPIALYDIERIEVTRAPNAATFGPNSFYAVISIKTRSPSTSESIYANLESGGNQFYTTTLSKAGKFKAADYRLTLQAEHDQGFKNIPDNERSRLIDLQTTVQLDKNQRIHASAGFLTGGHIEEVTVSGLFLSPFENTKNGYLQLLWDKSSNVDSGWKLQFYHNNFEIEESEFYIFPADEILGNPDLEGRELSFQSDRSSRSLRTETEYQINRRLSTTHRIALGGALRLDSINSEYLFDDSRTREIQTARLFGHSEWAPTDYLEVNSGFLIEHNTLTGVTTSPRLSANILLTPRSSFKLGYSHGVRSPLLSEESIELDFDAFLSNGLQLTDVIVYDSGQKLEPESTDVFELAYLYANTKYDFQFDAKLNYRKVRNSIGLQIGEFEADTVDGEARYHLNQPTWSTRSVEFELSYRPKENHLLRLAYSRAFDLHPPRNDRLSPPIHTLSMLGAVRLPYDIILSGEYYYTSDWSWNEPRRQLPSKLDRLDLKLQKGFRWRNLDGKVSLQAELELSENVDYWTRNEVEDWYFGKIEFSLP